MLWVRASSCIEGMIVFEPLLGEIGEVVVLPLRV